MRRLAIMCALAACGDAPANVVPDGATDAGSNDDVAQVTDAAVEAEAEAGDALVSITTSPAMSPAFALDVFDYALRCPSAHDAVAVTITTTAGSVTTNEDFVPNEDYVAAGAYHIRCLPAD